MKKAVRILGVLLRGLGITALAVPVLATTVVGAAAIGINPLGVTVNAGTCRPLEVLVWVIGLASVFWVWPLVGIMHLAGAPTRVKEFFGFLGSFSLCLLAGTFFALITFVRYHNDLPYLINPYAESGNKAIVAVVASVLILGIVACVSGMVLSFLDMIDLLRGKGS